MSSPAAPGGGHDPEPAAPGPPAGAGLPDPTERLLLSPGRVEAFSDGVFAVAATLLVVGIDVPAGLTEEQLGERLSELVPQVTMYVLSFWVIGRFWVGHHRTFSLVERVDGTLVALNLVLLGVVALIPFPTQLLGEYDDERAIGIYAVVMVVTAAASGSLSWWAAHARLGRAGVTADDFLVGRDAGMVVSIGFGLSLPLLLLFGGTVAQTSWLVMIPISIAVGRHRRRRVAARRVAPATPDEAGPTGTGPSPA